VDYGIKPNMKPEKPMLIPEDREFDSPPGDFIFLMKRGLLKDGFK